MGKTLSQRLSHIVALCLLVAIAGLTAISFFSSRWGWKIYLELLSHFQLQYLVICLLLLGLLGLTRRPKFILTGAFLVAIQLGQIVHWYLPNESQATHHSANLKVLIANINTQNRNYSQTLSLVKKENPDVAVFMEVDRTWVEQLDSLHEFLPYSFGKANPYNLGLVVYSKQELGNGRVNFFGTQKNASVLGNLVIDGQPISLIATHPHAPVRPHFFHSRNRQLDLMSQYVQTLSSPVLLVGDLNLTMWSPYYRRFIEKTGLKNARNGFGILPTWPAKETYAIKRIPNSVTLFFSIPIDHCLVSPAFRVVDIRTGPNIGSDHRPLIVDLSLATETGQK